MGTWGSTLYANDSTSDVRDSYIKYLRDGISSTEAYEKILEEFREYIEEDEEPLFWLALAETQWKTGRLLPEVKEKALEWIDKCGGLELWEESANGGAGWKKTLERLKLKLLSPMPPEKKIKKLQEINHNLWNVNDIYAYRFHGEGAEKHGYKDKYLLIQKIGEGGESLIGKSAMQVHIIDRVFDKLPTLDDINGARILPLDFPTRCMNEEPVWMSTYLHLYKNSEYPAKHLTFIGNRQGPANCESNYQVLAWFDIDAWLYEFHQLWQGVDYDTIGKGVYRYTKGNRV